MRVPPTSSEISTVFSRSRNAYQSIEMAPISSAEVPSQIRCECSRLISARHIRIHVALRGTSMPSSRSTASTQTRPLFRYET